MPKIETVDADRSLSPDAALDIERPESLFSKSLPALAPLTALIVVIGGWQILVPLREIPTYVLPTPLQIAEIFVNDYARLFTHAQTTWLQILAGFGLAVVVAIPMALTIFYSRPFEMTVYPFIVALQTVPKVALAPLLVMWLGFGIAPKVGIAFLISFFPIMISTNVGLRGLEREMVYLVRSMGASEWQTFRKVRMPAALPNIFGGLKIGVTLATVGAIIGEYVAADRGLGYLQMVATSQFNTALNFAALLMIALIGVVNFFGVLVLEKLLVPWQGKAE